MAYPVAHPDQTVIDTANASFWDELCGSAAARAWGVTDSSIESLRRYDKNFLKYYPYLDQSHSLGESARQDGPRSRPRLRYGVAKAGGERRASSPASISPPIQSPWSIIACARAGFLERLSRAIFSRRPLPMALSTRSSQSAACIIPAISAARSQSCRRLLAPGGRPHRHGVLRLLVSPAVERAGTDDPLFHARAARTFGYKPRWKNLRLRSRARWSARAVHRVCLDQIVTGSLQRVCRFYAHELKTLARKLRSSY